MAQYYMNGELVRVDRPDYPHVYTHVVTRAGKIELWRKSAAAAEEGRRDLMRQELRYMEELEEAQRIFARRQRAPGWYGETLQTAHPDLLAAGPRGTISESRAQEIFRRYPTEAALRDGIRACVRRAEQIVVRPLEIRQ